MTKRIVAFAVSIVACAAPLVAPCQETNDNPLTTAKVGDFAVYKVTLKVDGRIIETIVKKNVVAKSDTEVTLRIIVTDMGEPRSPEEEKVNLTKPFNFLAVMGRAHTFEKTGEGREKLKIGNKTYDCNWISGKRDGSEAPAGMPDVKVWYSKAAPVTGIVKVEYKSVFLWN